MIGKVKNYIWPQKIIAKFSLQKSIDQKAYLKLQKDIEKAYKCKNEIAAVVFVINSPGGSPVYSSLIGSKLVSFAREKKAPYYTFAEDVAASGGYWLLCQGDQVYAHKSSIVGSIGVVSALGAFKGPLEAKKIQRVTITTDENLIENKVDPFGKHKISEEDSAYVRAIGEQIFVNFKTHVMNFRGTKFYSNSLEKIFSADAFTGDEAKNLGLIDELGLFEEFSKQKYPDIKVEDFSKISAWERTFQKYMTRFETTMFEKMTL